MSKKLIDIQEHCFRLGQFLGELDPFDFMLSIEWLDIAAGVESVKVVTGKHDDCLMYCGIALGYEDKRSELLSYLTTKLTIFNFVWGSFESIAKAIGLSRLPRHLNRSRNSIVDKAIWFLKQNYSQKPHIAFYDDELYRLRKLIEKNEYYKNYSNEFKLLNFCELNGLGLHVVRMLRNELAHGSAKMPTPDDWKRGSTDLLLSEHRHLELIDACTRILLLTIQMLLLAHVSRNEFIVECLLDEAGFKKKSTAEEAIYVMHFYDCNTDKNQISLFE